MSSLNEIHEEKVANAVIDIDEPVVGEKRGRPIRHNSSMKRLKISVSVDDENKSHVQRLIRQGLTYKEDFISRDEEKVLLDVLTRQTFHTLYFRGTPIMRTKFWNSDVDEDGKRPKYTFPGSSQMPPQSDWIPELKSLRDRIKELYGVHCHQAIVTKYPRGAGIGLHKDKHFDHFFIITLGIERKLVISSTNKWDGEIKTITPKSRSLIHFTKELNEKVFHGIKRTRSQKITGHVRYSIVFRPLRKWE